MKNLFTNLMKTTAKRTQNAGGGTSHERFPSHIFKYVAMILMVFCLGTGEMWGQTLIEADDMETSSGTGASMTVSGWSNGTGSNACDSIARSSEARTGSYSMKTCWNNTGEKQIQTTNASMSLKKNEYLHCIGWAKLESTDDSTTPSNNIITRAAPNIGGVTNGDTIKLNNSTWRRFVGAKKASSDNATCYVIIKRKHEKKKNILYDDIVIYKSTNATTDIVAPTAASSASASTSEISWTNGSDANTGRQNTLIWRRTSGSSDDLSLNNQGKYAASATDQSGHWTCVSATVAAGTDASTSSYDGTFSGGDRYAIVHRDLAYNYSTPTYVTVASACSATANAGADKATTYGVGVEMAATAASSGFTGAWSIKTGSPSTAAGQLGTPSSNTMTFTPDAVGTYTLYWTVTNNSDATCKAKDSADVVVSKADMPSTGLATGTATSITASGATLPFTMTSTSGVGSLTIKVYTSSDDKVAKTISNITPATSGSQAVTGLSASTTYYYKITPIGDANHNDGDETSASSTFTTDAPACSAPTSPSISGTTSYTAGGTISLTASATGTDGSTTYQWYKGDPEDSGVSQGDASTDGATFSKASCVVADAGTYYCVISNGAGCEVTTYQAITVAKASMPSTGLATGTATSITTSGATLPFTMTSTSGVGSLTIKVYKNSDNSLVKTISNVTAATSGSADVTGLDASTTYYYKITPIGDANHNDGSETSASSTFTTLTVTYTVTYAGNSPTSGSAPTDSNSPYSAGATVTVLGDNSMSKTGYTFRGWTDGTTFYKEGQKFNITGNTTLTAVWDAGGGGDCETTLFSTDFSNAVWSGITGICRGSNSKDTTYNGITFHSYNSTAKPFVVDNSAGTLTWCNNNMGNNYWIAIPVTSVNGSITITVDNGSSNTNFKWALKRGTTVTGSPGSGTNAMSSAADPATITIDTVGASDYVVYLGRQGSGLTTLTSISITTPCVKSNYYVAFANQTGFGGSTTLQDTIKGVPSGKKIVPPSDPTAVGYTFSGWYSDAACTAGNEVNLSTMTVTADRTIYAKWCVPHTITWKVNGLTYTTGTPTTETTDCDGITTMPTAPANNTLSDCANSFRGWSATNLYGASGQAAPADLFRTASDAPTINADKTFYAVFGTGTDKAYVGTVMWSEDWTGESNGNKPSGPTTSGSSVYGEASIEYTWTDGAGSSAGTSKVSSDGSSFATKPEALIGKKGSGDGAAGGYLTISGIPSGGADSLVLQFYKNSNTLVPTVSGEGYAISDKISGSGEGIYVYYIKCGSGSTFDLTLTATTTSNVRVDDIVVKVKRDGATNCRCICPSLTVTPKLVTASTPIFITSAANKTVRSQDSLRIVGSGLDKSATLSISSPASKFALKSRTNGALTTDATGAIDTVAYIYYTPGEGDTGDDLDKNNSFTITDGTNSETVSQALIGRHLPANFVIAAKVEDTWYALPADEANGTPDPVEITVDDDDNPTTATTTEVNAYSLYGQTNTVINGGNGHTTRLEMHGIGPNGGSGHAPLFGSTGTGSSLGESGSATLDGNIGSSYWWIFTQTNTSVSTTTDVKYNMTVANGNSKHVRIYSSKWGLYSSGVDEIRLIPWVSSAEDPEVYTVSGTTSVCLGDEATITLDDSQEGATYQLYKDNKVVKGESVTGTGSSLEWTVTAAGTYTVKVEADATYNSATMDGSAVISYKTATAIGTQPATAVSAHDGESFTLGTGMVASGQGDLSYQWYIYSNAGGDDEDDVDGATGSTYTISKSAGTYYYKVEVSAACGEVKSDMITVTVDNLHKLTYDANGGSGEPEAEYRAAGTAALSATEPTRSNYRFLGWNTKDDGTGDHYDAGASYTMGSTAVTLYAEWGETATLTWNLNVNTAESSIGTASKASNNARISNSTDMTNMANYGSLTITSSAKASLTSTIATPASYDADKYMYVTFDVPDDYEFVPTNISVKAQPVTDAKDVKLVLTDGVNTITKTQTSVAAGSISTITETNTGETVLTGTVTLKIYCYGANTGYRLGSPITIAGNIDYVCPERATITSPTTAQSIKLYTDQSKTLSVSATAYAGTLNYQWQKDGVDIDGATSDTYTVVGSGLTVGTTYKYTCNVSETSPASCATVTSPAVSITAASPDCGYTEFSSAVLTSKSAADRVNATLLVNGLGDISSGSCKLNGAGAYFGLQLASGSFEVGDSIEFKIKKNDGTEAYIFATTDTTGLQTTDAIYTATSLTSGDNIIKFIVTSGTMLTKLNTTKKIAIVRRTKSGVLNQNHSVYYAKVKRYACADIVVFDDAKGNGNWSDEDNWIGANGHGATPTLDDRIVINKSMTVDVDDAQAAEIVMSESAKLIIGANKAIEIAGTIKMEDGSAPTANDLLLESDDTGNATLIFDNSNSAAATVQMYSKASTAGADWTWQYVAAPAAVSALYNYYGGYLYKWTGSWTAVTGSDNMELFAGYCSTYPTAGHTYEIEGTLAATTSKDIAVAAGKSWVCGNSWTGPIQVAQMTAADFVNLEATVYLFNTGMDSTGNGGTGTAAGTYRAVTPASAAAGSPSVISSMQGFYVKNTGESAGTLKLSYSKHVRPSGGRSIANGAMYAPKRVKDDTTPEKMKIVVAGNRYESDMLLFAREDFSHGYDVCWDGRNINDPGAGPLIYTLREDGTKDAISAIPEFEGAVVGFHAGEDNEYTFKFTYDGEGVWYLNDLQEQNSTRISTGSTYRFMTGEGDAARFVISATPCNAPMGIESSVISNQSTARKVMIDGMLYIIRDGRIYDATGALVK